MANGLEDLCGLAECRVVAEVGGELSGVGVNRREGRRDGGCESREEGVDGMWLGS